MRYTTYTYYESLMKDTIDYFIKCYTESDKYTLILRLPFLLIMFIVAILISLIVDIFLAHIRFP